MCKVTKEVGSPKRKTDTNVDRVQTLVHSVRRLGKRQIAEELNMNRGKSVTDYYGGFGNEKNFRRDGASNLDV
jgi:hypothetical protein